jgi:NAD(P)-dependent dehydrogenase (short-subunit alcohol dehydrogenase family)
MMSLALAQNGAKVYIASRKLPVLQGTADEINADPQVKKAGGQVIPLKADLRTRKDCEALGDELKKRESRLHVLINNSWVGERCRDFAQ